MGERVKPILFSGQMICALLREVEAPGTGKTMTRRLIAGAPDGPDWHCDRAGAGWRFVAGAGAPSFPAMLRWQAGDVLWVREKWNVPDAYLEEKNRHAAINIMNYAATPWAVPGRWRSSIHMPRWASRLTLTVEEVRVERLQDISEADARAEGVEATEFWREDHPPSICFSVLWDSINGVGSWATNPFVAAISFRPHLINVDAYLANPEPRP